MSVTTSEKAQEFARLEARLPDLWRSIEAGTHVHTSVVVPSLSFPQSELRKISGAPFYEERLLFSLIRLRDPRARVLYITSQPIHPHIIDYYLQLLAGVPASHARARLGLFCVYDGSTRPLTQKILERPRLIERIRSWVGDPQRAYLTCFASTVLERDLAVALSIPLNGVDPRHLWMGTKSGSRKIFAEAGIDCARGYEDVRSVDQVLDGLGALAQARPGLRRAVIKLDEGFAGAGNALFTYPEAGRDSTEPDRAALGAALERLEWSTTGETWSAFSKKLSKMGGVVEEFVEATEVHSPSVQLRVNPLGEPMVISTHDQVLGGSTRQVYSGCTFPANAEYRQLIQEQAMSIATVLARRGVVSRFGIDFLVLREPSEDWRAVAIEINLRMGGTTAPFLALQFLTGGEVDARGEFLSRRGERKHYYATDTLESPSYRGLLPEDLIDILTGHDLNFRPSTETGVLFHMIGALSEHGKVGVTCVGNSVEEARELFTRTSQILDRESCTESRGASSERPQFGGDDVAPME